MKTKTLAVMISAVFLLLNGCAMVPLVGMGAAAPAALGVIPAVSAAAKGSEAYTTTQNAAAEGAKCDSMLKAGVDLNAYAKCKQDAHNQKYNLNKAW